MDKITTSLGSITPDGKYIRVIDTSCWDMSDPPDEKPALVKNEASQLRTIVDFEYRKNYVIIPRLRVYDRYNNKTYYSVPKDFIDMDLRCPYTSWLIPLPQVSGAIDITLIALQRTPGYSSKVYQYATVKYPDSPEIYVQYTDVGQSKEVTIEEILEGVDNTTQTYVTDPIALPLLTEEYIYKNLLNLQYIRRVNAEVEKGADRDKLFYIRCELDFYTSLLQGAEYQWSCGNMLLFYKLLDKLKELRELNPL